MFVEWGGGVVDTTPPAIPTGLTPTPGNSTVSLDWVSNGETDLAGYHVYRGTVAGGPYGAITTSPELVSAYDDTSVSNGTTYYYVVTALDTSDNESLNSAEVSATPETGHLNACCRYHRVDGQCGQRQKERPGPGISNG